MKAIVVKPGEKDSIHMRDMPDPKLKPDQVAVKMLRVGLCGTDAEINHGLYGKPPDGDEFLILGHENFGVVEEVGKKVKGFKAGDLVVSTVRRPCGECYTCRRGENDMCRSGDYQERGIMRRHGFMAEYYVESPQWLNKIPKEVQDIGVLLEPMSVVEKGIDHAYLLQQRLPWKPKTGARARRRADRPAGRGRPARARARDARGRPRTGERHARTARQEDGRDVSLGRQQDAVRRAERDAADRHRHRGDRRRERRRSTRCRSSAPTACCAC